MVSSNRFFPDEQIQFVLSTGSSPEINQMSLQPRVRLKRAPSLSQIWYQNTITSSLGQLPAKHHLVSCSTLMYFSFYPSGFYSISSGPAASLRRSFLFTLTPFFPALFHHRLWCVLFATFPIIVLQSAAPCLDASCPVSVCARTHSSCSHLAGPPPSSGLMPLRQTLTRSAARAQRNLLS